MAASQKRPSTGVRVGRYVVLSRIGRGGMGMVYRARDEALERDVALKVLTLDGSLEGESRQRFAVEAKAAAQLQHPNIVTIYELGEQSGVPFIAMELLGGCDLESLLRSGEKLLLTEHLEIVVQLCRGLAYAHERRIVHRDVKPSNIRLLDDGAVKIMDFGIAKLGGVNLTQSGMVVGTVHYMSPEQVRGQPLDGRSDLFSAGIVLQELLTGARPFDGNTPTEILYKIVHAPAIPLPPPRDAVAEQLQGILDRALAKQVEARYSDAQAMADDLVEVQTRLALGQDRQREERALEAVGQTRRLLKEGHTQEAIARLAAIEQAEPDCVEARRARRAALRQQDATRRAVAVIEADDFPELAVTFQLRPTQRAAETQALTAVAAPTPPARHGLLWMGAGLLVLSVAAGLALLMSRGGENPRPPALRVRVRSEPPGAQVLVNGVLSETRTDGELQLAAELRQATLTFRKEGYAEASRVVTLPLGDAQGVTVQLQPVAPALRIVSDPPGATVTLDGRRLSELTPIVVPLDRSREHRLAVTLDGHVKHEQALAAGLPSSEVNVQLRPAGPDSPVSIASSYPLDVSWNGTTLARAQLSPQVTLPEGRHQLLLSAPGVFLKATLSVQARGGAPLALAAPGLGRINVRALPDNCEIHIDGIFADYPPIRDRSISAGTHRVQFRWPGGARSEESVEIVEGRAAFITGHKE